MNTTNLKLIALLSYKKSAYKKLGDIGQLFVSGDAGEGAVVTFSTLDLATVARHPHVQYGHVAHGPETEPHLAAMWRHCTKTQQANITISMT